MSTTAIYIILAVGFLFLFLILFLVGIKKKKKSVIYASIISFIAFVIIAIITGFTIIKSLFTGSEYSLKTDAPTMYKNIFGQAPGPCVSIIASEIPVIPRVDTRAAIKFTACSAEMKSILKQYPYTSSFQKTPDPFTANDSFSPSSIGDSAWKYYYELEPGAVWRTIWMSKDSTKVIVEQIED
ncbi:MAG: hypothetical protein K2P88_15210 [Chitinophagaceae bacterium]|nr:hypothetical protein [Chitinophagaceae bacterium]